MFFFFIRVEPWNHQQRAFLGSHSVLMWPVPPTPSWLLNFYWILSKTWLSIFWRDFDLGLFLALNLFCNTGRHFNQRNPTLQGDETSATTHPLHQPINQPTNNFKPILTQNQPQVLTKVPVSVEPEETKGCHDGSCCWNQATPGNRIHPVLAPAIRFREKVLNCTDLHSQRWTLMTQRDFVQFPYVLVYFKHHLRSSLPSTFTLVLHKLLTNQILFHPYMSFLLLRS